MSLGQKFTYRNKKILDHGGIKAHDIFVAFLDSACHSWLDSGSGLDPSGLWEWHDRETMWQHAHDKTLLILLRDEIIK